MLLGVEEAKKNLVEIQKDIINASSSHGDMGMEGAVRDDGTLAYIVEKSMDIANGGDRFDVAGWVLYSVATMHPFYQGNKRTAFMAAENSIHRPLDVDSEDGAKFMLNAARQEVSLDEIVAWLRAHAQNDGRPMDIKARIEAHKELLNRLSWC